MEQTTKLLAFGGVVVVAMLLRYVLIAVGAWGYFYRWRRHRLAATKLQARWPKTKDVRREVGYSLLTMGVFALVAISAFNPWVRPYTQLMSEPLEYGGGYLVFAFLLSIVLHDTYFYWMHRLLHHPKVFRIVHKVHHESTNPTPLAALAFHPLEAIFEAGIIYLLVFLFPNHGLVIAAFLLYMFVYNVYGHLGWELLSPRFQRTWVGRWFNTSTAHNAHHQYFKGNYGLYFLWWDKWMGTYRPRPEPRPDLSEKKMVA